MTYFKIGDVDFSDCVRTLAVNKTHNYTSQTNAAGNTVVDYLNAKRTINVGIIPLDSERMMALQRAINTFSVSLSYRNPNTGVLEENVNCIIPSTEVNYYTIRTDKVMFNELELSFIEL